MLDRTADTEVPAAVGVASEVGAGAVLPLEVGGLTFEVAGRRLVDSVDLVLRHLATTVIMGPNGAGKSLLLRLLHGLIPPSAGTIRWGGAAMSDGVRRRQAMVFQRAVLLRRSAGANVDFALGLNGGRHSERRDELLALVGLLDKSRQPARLLSGGEQQRLALARALATSPDVLFLDEPTASLDPGSMLVIEEIVHAAARTGVKVIFVTHDVAQARRLAGDVVFLHQGRISEHSPAETFFDAPASEAARAYLEGRILV